jgi:hypothetical protein
MTSEARAVITEDAWGAAARYSDMAIAMSTAGVRNEADRLSRLAAAYGEEAANLELYEAVEILLRT